MPAAAWIGFGATISCIVEQFGLAISPRWPSSASGLTSDTTSGICGSRRKADELSTTTAPASTNFCAHAREVDAPAENSAMSKPWIESSLSARIVTPPSSLPALRSEANGTISAAGKPRSLSLASMTVPTAPVAPTTATLYRLMPSLRMWSSMASHAALGWSRSCDLPERMLDLDLVRPELERLVQRPDGGVDRVRGHDTGDLDRR